MRAGAGREEEEEGPWDVVLHQLHGMDECEEFMLLTGVCLFPHFIGNWGCWLGLWFAGAARGV